MARAHHEALGETPWDWLTSQERESLYDAMHAALSCLRPTTGMCDAGGEFFEPTPNWQRFTSMINRLTKV